MRKPVLPPTPKAWKSANPKQAARLTDELVDTAMQLLSKGNRRKNNR
ncbi:MAG: hypothetical protein J6A87_01605 [Clostridia bacterium]|nr:hypothetical protein [Clostridia bacterium]